MSQYERYLLPCVYTTYALLKSNSDENDVFDEFFQEWDQAIQNGDLQSSI